MIKISITRSLLLACLLVASCGKSGGSNNSGNNLRTENDPCNKKSLCTNQKNINSIQDLRSAIGSNRSGQSTNGESQSLRVGFSFKARTLSLDSEYNWDLDTFEGDCIESYDTTKTVYRVNYDLVDEDGDSYNEVVYKVRDLNRQLITQTPQCVENFSSSAINTEPRFESEEIYINDFDLSNVDQTLLDNILKEYKLSVLNFNGDLAMRLETKVKSNFPIAVYRWDDEQGRVEESEVIGSGTNAFIIMLSAASYNPWYFTKALYKGQLASYRNRFFVESWFESVDPSEIPYSL